MNEEEKAIKFLENKTTNYSLSGEALHYYSILYYLIINLQKKNKQLQEQLKEKEEVIKEAREYVNHSKKNIDESGMYVETYTKWKLVSDVLDDLLEILSKGENK